MDINRKPTEKEKAEQDLRRMLSAPGGIAGILAVAALIKAEARAERAAAAAADAAEEERRTAAAEKAAAIAAEVGRWLRS